MRDLSFAWLIISIQFTISYLHSKGVRSGSRAPKVDFSVFSFLYLLICILVETYYYFVDYMKVCATKSMNYKKLKFIFRL